MPTITDLEQITPDLLEELALQWDERRVHKLIRVRVMALGNKYRQAYAEAFNLEVRCKIRARELHAIGFDKQEIGELFDVERRVVNRWLK